VNRVVTAAVMAAALAASATAGWAGEERTVKAVASWLGQGRFVPTGEGTLLFFAGSFSGTMFVDDGEGALHAAKMVCPGVLEVDINGGRQRGEGRCVMFAVRDTTSEIYARWSCAGVHQVECRGQFVITGGSGRFAGITGQGEFRVRTALGELTPGRYDADIVEKSVGLAEWPALHYRIP